MKSKLALAVAGVLAAFVSPAMAQYRTHADFGGYTYKTPSTTYMYRYDSGATYNRIGNLATYSANNGTTGYSLYAPGYRIDSFSNPYQRWSGSGTTFYKPAFSTYSRTYSTPVTSIYDSYAVPTTASFTGSAFRPSLYCDSVLGDDGNDLDSDLGIDGSLDD